MSTKARQMARKAAAVLSALVMIEVIIMISPFAFYWYSFYSPTLQTLHRWAWTAWLECFILPHSVITQSAVLEFFRWGVGRYLFSLGMLGFLVLAGQIYSSKLRKKGLVASGVYRYIRHPQYLCLSFAGLGLLTIWPRMIIFVFFLWMLIAYYFLARSEESRLLKRYPEYEAYYNRTAMFIPGRVGGKIYRLIFGRLPNQALARGLCVVLVFVIGLELAFGLRAYTITSSEKVLVPEAKTLAISGWPRGQDDVERAIRLALDEPSIRDRLKAEGAESYTAHLLPANYGMIGMFTDLEGDHQMWSRKRVGRFSRAMFSFFLPFFAPDLKSRIMGSPSDRYHVIFSRVDGPNKTLLPLSQVTDARAKMTAVAVVDIDAASNQITEINLNPPPRSFWGDITMPMF